MRAVNWLGPDADQPARRAARASMSAVADFRFTVADSFANGPCCANVATITTVTKGAAILFGMRTSASRQVFAVA